MKRKALVGDEATEASRIAAIAARAESKISNTNATKNTVTFLSKAQRQELALSRLETKRVEMEAKRKEQASSRQVFKQNGNGTSSSRYGNSSSCRDSRNEASSSYGQNHHSSRKTHHKKPPLSEEEAQINRIKAQYLEKKVNKKKVMKTSEKFTRIFKFDWEPSEDTSVEYNPLYANKQDANLGFGRGYRAGVDLRDQRKNNSFVPKLTEKRNNEQLQRDVLNQALSEKERESRKQSRMRQGEALQRAESERVAALEVVSKGSTSHWSSKEVGSMTERDWRIFREDFDIFIKGGKPCHPIRKWKEGNIPETVLRAISDLKFDRPSPIQMQCIPIGLKGRDIIGIAETGSGKTW